MTGFANIVSARQLRAARVMAGLTQRQLSIEAGFNPRAAKYWESQGDYLPTTIPENLAAIEETLPASKYLPNRPLGHANWNLRLRGIITTPGHK